MTTVDAIGAKKTDTISIATDFVKDTKGVDKPVFKDIEMNSSKEDTTYPDLKLSETVDAAENSKTQENKFKKFMKGAFVGLFEGLFTKTSDLAAIGFIATAALGYTALGGVVFGSIIAGIAITYAIKEGLNRLNGLPDEDAKAIA